MLPLADDTPRRHAPVVLWTLSALCVLVFLYEQTLDAQALQALFDSWGLVPARLQDGDPTLVATSFVTSMFLHGGWLHLLGNLWTFWIFGDNVEDRMGPWRFTLFYLLCGVAAGGVHVASGPGSAIPTVGASGAIAGVLGAYGLLYPRGRVLVVIPIAFYPMMFRTPAMVFIGLWFVLQVWSGAQAVAADGGGGVAWWAHVGGLVAGALLLPLFLHPARRKREELEVREPDAFQDRMWQQLASPDQELGGGSSPSTGRSSSAKSVSSSSISK